MLSSSISWIIRERSSIMVQMRRSLAYSFLFLLVSFATIGWFFPKKPIGKTGIEEQESSLEEIRERESESIVEIKEIESESEKLIRERSKILSPGGKNSAKLGNKAGFLRANLHLINRKGFPVTDAEVLLFHPKQSWEINEQRVTIRGVPNQVGMISFSLPAKQWRLFQAYPILVRTQGKQTIFQGQVILEPYMELQISEQILLKGRLVLPAGLRGIRGVALYFLDSDSSSYGGDFLGRTNSNEKGEFALKASPPRKSGDVRAAISIGKNMISIRTQLKTLASENGAVLEFKLHPFRIKVIHEKGGEGISGVQIRVREDSGSQNSFFQYVAGVTNALGEVSFFLPEKKLVVIAKKGGFFVKASKMEVKVGFPLRREMTLKRISIPQVLHGFVVDSQGKVVKNAVVSCFPHAIPKSALAECGIVVRSNPYGDFQLQLPFQFPVQVRAFHPDYGFSKPVVLHEMKGVHKIEFGPTGTLNLSIQGTVAGHPLSSPGRIRWLLKKRGVKWSRNGSRNGVFSLDGFRIDTLPVGRYLLYVVESEGLFLGGTEVSISHSGITHSSIKVVPGGFFEGRVIASTIQGKAPPRLHLIRPFWAKKDFLKGLFFASWKEGRFRLFAGNLKEAQAEMTPPGGLRKRRVFLKLGQENLLHF